MVIIFQSPRKSDFFISDEAIMSNVAYCKTLFIAIPDNELSTGQFSIFFYKSFMKFSLNFTS